MAARPYRLTAPLAREHPLQAAIARTLTIEIARAGHLSREGVVWFAVDHADFAGNVPGARQGRGIIAGIPDIWFLWRGRAFVIEVKADDGVLSDPQRQIAAAFIAAAVPVAVARNWLEVLAILDEWQIPRARRVKAAA
jgi:hypothetical protein